MIQTIQDVSDCVPLYLPHSLYLKPSAKFNVSVALPNAITGKTISNYEVMEKMRQMILPDKFSVLKVSVLPSFTMLRLPLLSKEKKISKREGELGDLVATSSD